MYVCCSSSNASLSLGLLHLVQISKATIIEVTAWLLHAFFIPMVTCCYSCLSPEDRKRKVSFERISDYEFIARLAVGSLIWECQSLRCVTFQVTARRNLARRCHGSRQLSSPRFQLRVLQLVSCQSKISPVNFSTETLTMDFKNSRRNEKWLIRSAESRHAGSRIFKEKNPINHNSDEQRKQDESNQLEHLWDAFSVVLLNNM